MVGPSIIYIYTVYTYFWCAVLAIVVETPNLIAYVVVIGQHLTVK